MTQWDERPLVILHDLAANGLVVVVTMVMQ